MYILSKMNSVFINRKDNQNVIKDKKNIKNHKK